MKRTATIVLLAALALLAGSGARAQEVMRLYGYGNAVQTPGHPVTLLYQTVVQSPNDLDVRVYRMSTAQYVRAARTQGDLSEAAFVTGAPVAHGHAAHGEKQEWQRKVVLAPLAIGTYAVVARLDRAVLVETLDVTTVGIAQAQSSDGRTGTIVFPADLRTYRRYPGTVDLRVENGAATHALEVRDGVAMWMDRCRTCVLTARAADGSFALANAPDDDASVAPAEAGFVQTDRPVYRPGDTIDVRAVMRDGGIGAYVVPTGTRKVRLQAPDGSDAFDREATLSQFGSVNASIRLPEDAPAGAYSLTVGTALSKTIFVAAYKKPEYELSFATAPEHVVGGERAAFVVGARYFFGRPAANMRLHYTVDEHPRYYDWWGPYGGIVERSGLSPREDGKHLGQGDLRSDALGQARFDVATAAVDANQDVSIAVEARDASGRTVSTSAQMLVTAAAFQVSVSPDAWFGQAGSAATLHVSTRGYDSDAPAPNASVDIVVTGRRYDNGKEREIDKRAFEVTTDRAGDGTLAWTPPAAGDYTIEASAKDANGRTTRASTYLWVFGSGDETWLAPVEQPLVIAKNATAAPGGPVEVAIALPKPDRDVVVIASTDRIVSARTVRAIGLTARVTLEAPRDATSVTITAMLPGENGVEFGNASISIAPPARALRVVLQPAKRRYEPGERAHFDVRVVDANGRPARAELGIGVVDESLYAVQNEEPLDPVAALYAGRAYISGDASWFRPNRGAGELVRAGSEADVYSVNAGSAPRALKSIESVAVRATTGPQVRSNFLDAAYWSPSVVTDAAGRASVEFTWPDNLTTWRATGIGITQAGDAGSGTGSALVTKDFLVRLETPRFLRAGDRSTITGIAQGLAAHPDVRLRLDAGALASRPLESNLRLDAFAAADASWPVVAPGVGSVAVTLSGSDGVLDDAMRVLLPLEAGTAAEHVRDAGSLPQRASFAVTVPPGYLGGALHLTLAPSSIAELIENQRLLDVYPYYCTEQTMSAGLPAAFIARALRQTQLRAPPDVDVDEIVRHAIARLAQLQHEDGSWGWWETDPAHPFMTAYALYGLAEFRKDGYRVGDATFDRGVDSLVEQLGSANGDTLAFWGGGQRGSEWNTRAFMLYALADAAPARVDRTLLARTLAHDGDLNPYAISVLGLAEHRLGNDDAARRLLALLDRRAIRSGPFEYWRGNTWHYAWEDDPIETTAYALRFENAMHAPAERIDAVVSYLRAQRRGNWWYTTKDTAAAIYALVEAIRPGSGEFSPDETVRVLVDGHEVRSLHVTAPILDAADASVVVPSSLVHDGSTVAFETTGRGALYWSSDAVRYVPVNAGRAADGARGVLDGLFAAAPALSVERHYRAGHAGPWRVGDEIFVEVTVRARNDVQYVAIEDPFPAGAEHQPEQGSAGDEAWSGLQLLDDRAVFFADRLYPGQPLTIRYSLRATTPGRYTAPGPSAYAMYGPPVSSLGRPESVEIAP